MQCVVEKLRIKLLILLLHAEKKKLIGFYLSPVYVDDF